MKKVFMIVAVGGVFTLTSCKKDYTCECTEGGDTESFVFQDQKKKDAEAACDTWNTLYSIGGGSCTLK